MKKKNNNKICRTTYYNNGMQLLCDLQLELKLYIEYCFVMDIYANIHEGTLLNLKDALNPCLRGAHTEHHTNYLSDEIMWILIIQINYCQRW